MSGRLMRAVNPHPSPSTDGTASTRVPGAFVSSCCFFQFFLNAQAARAGSLRTSGASLHAMCTRTTTVTLLSTMNSDSSFKTLTDQKWFKGAGLWTDSGHGVADRLRQLAAERGLSPAQLAVGAVLAEPHVTAALVGCSSPAQVHQLARILPVTFPPGDDFPLTKTKENVSHG